MGSVIFLKKHFHYQIDPSVHHCTQWACSFAFLFCLLLFLGSQTNNKFFCVEYKNSGEKVSFMKCGGNLKRSINKVVHWRKKKRKIADQRHGDTSSRGSPWNVPALSSHFHSYVQLSAAETLLDLSSIIALLLLAAANWLYTHSRLGSDDVTSISSMIYHVYFSRCPD